MATESTTESSTQGSTRSRKRTRRDKDDVLPENEEVLGAEHQSSCLVQRQNHASPRKRKTQALRTKTRNSNRNGHIVPAPLPIIVSTSASVPVSSSPPESSSIQASSQNLHPPIRPTLPPRPVPSQHLLLTRILENQEKILNYLENYIIPYTYKYIYAGGEEEEKEDESNNSECESPANMTQSPQLSLSSPLHRQSSQDQSIHSPTETSPTNTQPYRTIITVPPEQLHNHIQPTTTITVEQQSENVTLLQQPSSESDGPHTKSTPPGSTAQDAAQCSTELNTSSPQPLTPDIDTESQPNECQMKSSPEAVIAKYPKLRGDKKMGALAVALARECYFGKEIMRGATVSGRGPGTFPLPTDSMKELQRVILSLCPSYQNDMTGFRDNIWNKCRDAINHACSSYRRKMS